MPLQSEDECEEVIDMKTIFYSHVNKLIFTRKILHLTSSGAE